MSQRNTRLDRKYASFPWGGCFLFASLHVLCEDRWSSYVRSTVLRAPRAEWRILASGEPDAITAGLSCFRRLQLFCCLELYSDICDKMLPMAKADSFSGLRRLNCFRFLGNKGQPQ